MGQQLLDGKAMANPSVHIHSSRNGCLPPALRLFLAQVSPTLIPEVEMEQGCSPPTAPCRGHPCHAPASPMGAWYLLQLFIN